METNLLDLEYRELMDNVAKFDKVVDLYSMVRNDTKKSIENLEAKYQEGEESLERFRKAGEVVKRITDRRNDGVKQHIKGAINSGINAILQKNAYTLTIEDDDRGTSKVTNIEFISNDTGKPRKIGTAVKQSSSLIFVVTILKLAKSSKFIALDEYLSGASGTTASKLSDVLSAMAKNDGFQMFVVNHVLEISDNPEIIRYYFKKDSDEIGLKLDEYRTKLDREKRNQQIELGV